MGKISMMIQKIFNKPMMEVHEYNQSIVMNPD